jgi:hypothetical protein
VKKIWKAVGAVLGGLTGTAVIAVAGAFGADVTPEFGAAVALILATFGTYLAPKNADG